MGRSALLLTVTMAPEPLHWFCLQSPGVCIATGVPLAVKLKPHTCAEHVRVWHSVSVPAHCVGALHCTQAPAPSQNDPPLWVHAVSTARGGLDGTPAVQTSSVHCMLSTGTSALSFTLTIAPDPLHWFFLQSPAVCDATGVPLAAKLNPHTFAVQARVWHSVSVPGHVDATTHSTHAPAPLQNEPPFWLHVVPDPVGGLEGMPAVQTSLVH